MAKSVAMNLDLEFDRLFNIDHPGQMYQGSFHTPHALYTSYEDFFEIYKDLDSNVTSLTDLGSGNCRAAFLFFHLCPTLKVYSIEKDEEVLSKAQVAAQKLGLPSHHFIQGDLFDIKIPQTDVYFLYQSSGELLYALLEKIREHDSLFTLYAIESHGDLISKLKKDFGHLKLTKTIGRSVSKRLDPFIYRFDSTPYIPLSKDALEEVKFTHQNLIDLRWSKDWVVEIEEEDHLWVASTYLVQSGLKEDSYEFIYPHRNVDSYKIRRIMRCPKDLGPFIHQRFEKDSKIRKIILAPQKQIEYTDLGRINL